ncbi:serine/threonine-protein kinase [Streptomyces avidinii]|uniref:Protein kinase domain-containing protein n=1 Tax=Streptomyces avidinii TaxID=1895 RepID=A0ABS4KXJ6_STRAV|nr:serine/threonine-protein kinase [Streptomyces avidinii]MBP2034718.1 hypothetical protein [Streptomyces avidinii]GGY88352.1 hypothetical protein GCM10010343_11870 [Streptomyces avidinii]
MKASKGRIDADRLRSLLAGLPLPRHPLGPNDPQEIAGYRLLAKIGEGGMGSVYFSRTRGNQPVALKVIRREFAQEQDFRARFEHEVQAARRVQGYHIVPVLDHDTSGEQPWLATAFVPGLPLDEALAAHGPLPLPAIRSGGFIGTPQYMSPEHALGKTVTPATDIFALGLIAAVVATGRHPYGEGAGISIAASIANTPQQAPDLSGYPDALRPLLERCLAADAGQRPLPAEVSEWCRKSAGRELRDFADWLPAPVAAEIARREQLAQTPAQPAQPAQPAYTPTHTPEPARPAYAPTQASVPAHPAYAPTQQATGGHPHSPIYDAPTSAAYAAPPAAGGLAAPAAAASGRSRVPLIVGAGVLAVALIAGGSWYLTREDGTGSKATASDGKQRTADQPKDAAAPAAQPSGSAAAPQASASGPAYTEVYKDKPVKLLAGREFGKVNAVDLDFPKVAPFGDIGWKDRELEMGFEDVKSSTAFGKSKGTTPKLCAAGAATNPIPERLPSSDLSGADSAIVQGDLLCTVTSKGNLAMVKIVAIEPSSSKQYTVPTYLTEVTLWKRQP